MKCRAVLRLAVPAVVQAGSGDIRVAEPFLDFGDVRLVPERVRRRRRSHRVRAQSFHLDIDAGLGSILDDDVAVDGGGIEMLVECAGTVVFHRAEEGAAEIRLRAAPVLRRTSSTPFTRRI